MGSEEKVVHVRGSDKFHSDESCPYLNRKSKSTRNVSLDKAELFWDECGHCSGQAAEARDEAVARKRTL